ncbi:hypothetical protein [Methanocaldococcus fervens]|uniref:Uncharacterized protein n=1 Tax=Methanocaldococcus fervens (strain DSM 4213 / JCM 15782 / AG86) TaxID=573064 RepID=C7P5X6_METFA|nr:hypothetical protein [Methanocaldococcus fervens]ACV23958.1 hypothetical protein Mefer_0116 [Methanocaldococcus fervens AG86]
MDEKEIEERLEVLNKKILEIEKRVDAKLKENEKKLNEKAEKILKQEALIALGIYIKTIEDLKRSLKIIRINIIILGTLIIFLYLTVILLTLKLLKL